MRLLLLFVALFSFGATSFAATPTDGGKMKKVTIKTSAICGMCKTTIEKALYALDGVENAELDVVTKKVKIKYDSKQLTEATLRQAISAAGYDADEVPARQKAYDNLPGCCKKGSSCDGDMEG